MLAALRSGSFVTLQRMRVYSALLLVAYVATIVALVATADGIVDKAGRPLGTDFANVYSAGRLVLRGSRRRRPTTGRPTTTCRGASRAARTSPTTAGTIRPPSCWSRRRLRRCPISRPCSLYQVATLAAYLAVVRAIAGRPEAWLLALAFPAVFVNVTHGHNGFLTAALLGGALLVLDRRPLLAGVLIGCLAYKPQLGLLIPLVLVATGRWRVIAPRLPRRVLALAGLTWALLGTDVFAAFWHSLPLTQLVVREGAPGFYKIQSTYAALRLLGASAGVANVAQLIATLGAAVGLIGLWRSAAAFELKAAGLILASVIATPYVLDYDLVVLAPAIAFLAAHGLRRGFAPYEVALLVALWVLPFVARSIAELTAVSLTPLVLIAAFGLVLQRAGVLTYASRASAGGRAQ